MGTYLRTRAELDRLKRAEVLNEAFGASDANEILTHVIKDEFPGEVAIVSSFGAESGILLSLAAEVDPDVPVFFLDTHKHFQETLEYVSHLKDAIGLTNVKIVEPTAAQLSADDPNGDLHALDQDRCCHIRKTLPMIRSLNPYRAWITGRKRFQNSERAALSYFEVEDRWIKVNPLALWDAPRLKAYAQDIDLPPHPLVKKGYLSIGCAPCTTPVAEGETDPRAGRWRGTEKAECGIHFVDGKVVRTANPNS